MILEIPEATPSNNKIKGMHYHDYKRARHKWSWLVVEAVPIKRPAIQKCDIKITRHGSRMLDWDNCYGGIKPLMDSLVIASKTNPCGRGVIEDDNPNIVLSLVMDQVKCKRKDEKTVIEINETR